MRLLEAPLLLICSLSLSGCIVLSSQPPVHGTIGFWFWQGSSVDPSYTGGTLDVVFAQVGTIRKQTMPAYVRQTSQSEQWSVYGQVPSQLPPAREYWLVYRYENRGVPDIQAASMLVAEITRLQEDARDRHLNVVGVQLDIDSPTSELSRYAAFVRAVRKDLPKQMQVSITALLDWFRSGTAIDEVIAQVDEFTPQFYDVGDPAAEGETAIAARIDPARWEPVFNRFRKRFRIGISSFGRVRIVPRETPVQSASWGVVFYGSLRPLDMAANAAFQLQTSRSAAGETVLSYRASRKVEVGYQRLGSGDTVQFIISTPEAIRDAVRSARQIGGYLAGVVFFRWPSSTEDWAMQPEEVLDAAAPGAVAPRKEPRVQTVTGGCAAVHCVDVYLECAGPLSPQPARYRIRASTPLEYFLPDHNVPVHLTAASELEVSLPAYCGRGRLYLGRAVSLQRVEFTAKVEK